MTIILEIGHDASRIRTIRTMLITSSTRQTNAVNKSFIDLCLREYVHPNVLDIFFSTDLIHEIIYTCTNH